MGLDRSRPIFRRSLDRPVASLEVVVGGTNSWALSSAPRAVADNGSGFSPELHSVSARSCSGRGSRNPLPAQRSRLLPRCIAAVAFCAGKTHLADKISGFSKSARTCGLSWGLLVATCDQRGMFRDGVA